MKINYFVKLEGSGEMNHLLVKEVFGDVEEIVGETGYAFVTPYDQKKNLDQKLGELKGCKVITCMRIEK